MIKTTLFYLNTGCYNIRKGNVHLFGLLQIDYCSDKRTNSQIYAFHNSKEVILQWQCLNKNEDFLHFDFMPKGKSFLPAD